MRGFRFVVCVTIFFFVVISSFCKHWNTVCSRCVCESRTTDWNVSACAHESDWKSTVSNEISRNDRWNCGTRVANELITIWTTARDKFNAALCIVTVKCKWSYRKQQNHCRFFSSLKCRFETQNAAKTAYFEIYLCIFPSFLFIILFHWIYELMHFIFDLKD